MLSEGMMSVIFKFLHIILMAFYYKVLNFKFFFMIICVYVFNSIILLL